MTARSFIQRLLHHFGFDLIRYHPASHALARRAQLLRYYRINFVLDVGANRGQYARSLRSLGYHGRIVSWEPSPSAFRDLQKVAAGDPQWTVVQAALGAEDTTMTLNISQNDCSNSFLDMLPRHQQAAPTSAYYDQAKVDVQRLDSVLDQYRHEAEHLYLKIDTQGFEQRVLEGAAESLPKISLVKMELSLIPLYQGETLLPEMVKHMQQLSYQVVAIEPGYTDPSSGQMLQADVIFAQRRGRHPDDAVLILRSHGSERVMTTIADLRMSGLFHQQVL